MASLWGHAVGVFILLMMGGFIGIWIWAWRPHHQQTFGWLAKLPMEDAADSPIDTLASTKEERRS